VSRGAASTALLRPSAVGPTKFVLARRCAAIRHRGKYMNVLRAVRLDEKFSVHWRQYVLQSLGAAVVVFLVLLLLDIEHVVVIASLGSSAFIVFAMPKAITARPRNLVGGQISGFLVGSLFGLAPHSSLLSSALVYALCVGVAILVMVVSDTEHPPAAGTALGVAVSGFSPSLLVSVVTSVAVLALAHHVLRSRLADLV